jgi:hypothetical protein
VRSRSLGWLTLYYSRGLSASCLSCAERLKVLLYNRHNLGDRFYGVGARFERSLTDEPSCVTLLREEET